MRGFARRPGIGTGPQSAERPTLKQKVKHHCGHWWWAYLLALIAVAVVVIFPLSVCYFPRIDNADLLFASLYVGFPRQAQAAVNQANLIVTSQAILSPATNSFYLNQSTVFITNSSQSADLDTWEGTLCLDPQCSCPFARVIVPRAQAKNGTQIDIAQTTEIVNMTEFDLYTRLALGSEEYTLYLEGQGKLDKAAWPRATVQYNKKITLTGMCGFMPIWFQQILLFVVISLTNRSLGLNGLKGFNLTEFHIISPPLDDGTNANGTIYIPNPSISTFEMGNLTLDMSVDGLAVGTALLKDVILIPGPNELSMTASTNQTAIGGLVLGPYKSGVLPIDVVGTSVTFHESHIPWYEQALQALPLQVNLNVIPALQEVGMIPPAPLT